MQPDQALQQLTDKLMKCVLSYKQTREERFLTDMRGLSKTIRDLGYHPYYYAKQDILIVSHERLSFDSPYNVNNESEHFDA